MIRKSRYTGLSVALLLLVSATQAFAQEDSMT